MVFLVRTSVRALAVVSGLAWLAGPAAAQRYEPDWYHGWTMWWSTNREDFLSPPPVGAASRTAPPNPELVTPEDRRLKIVPVLLDLLRDRRTLVREAAAIALGTCGDERDVGALIPLLADDDRTVSEAAVMGLGLLQSEDAVVALAKVVADTSAPERRRGLAALALGYSGLDSAQMPLLDRLGAGKDKLEACRMVGAALWCGGDGTAQRPDRCALVASSWQKLAADAGKRRRLLSLGIAALAKVRDPAVTTSIMETLRDTRFDLRAGAAIAAGRVIRADDKKNLTLLVKAAAQDNHTLPRRLMIISLGRIGGPEAIAHLEEEIRSSQKTFRHSRRLLRASQERPRSLHGSVMISPARPTTACVAH